jgi:hypothetical protein
MARVKIGDVRLSQESFVGKLPETVAVPSVTSATINNEYDVIVVGSGAAGGQTTYTLSMEGARVLMLEASRNYSPEPKL